MDARPESRVSHPVLHLEVVDRDGVRMAGRRVFCRLRRESVDVELCRSCVRAYAIRDGAEPSVDCHVVPPAGALDEDPLGVHSEIGTLLRSGTMAVATSASLADALRVLRAGDMRSVAVVGGDHVLVGVLYDVPLSERSAKIGRATDDVTTVMSTAFAIHESTPVRRALVFLASAHLRQAVVVNQSGVPLGVFRDVDGLRWIARARAGAVDPAWIDGR
jgi:CBS domain-containing protein